MQPSASPPRCCDRGERGGFFRPLAEGRIARRA